MTRGALWRQLLTRCNPDPRQGLGSQNPALSSFSSGEAKTSEGGENTIVVTPSMTWRVRNLNDGADAAFNFNVPFT